MAPYVLHKFDFQFIGYTPLMLAVSNFKSNEGLAYYFPGMNRNSEDDYLECVKLLVKFNADINCIDPHNGNSILQIAIVW